MNKFTDMFGKKTATINFVDLDNENKIIATSGELSGKKNNTIDFDAQKQIAQLQQEGYALADNNFDPKGEKPVFEEKDKIFAISFHHGHETIDYEHPGLDYSKDDLKKTIKQVVHYDVASNRSLVDNVDQVTFRHSVVVDRVTKKVIKDNGWFPTKQIFMMVGTPTLPGFVPDKAVVGGKTVSANDEDQEYTVKFRINQKPSTNTQYALINFVDINDHNKLIDSIKLSGTPNMMINYDPKAKIQELNKRGYVLINNGFNGKNEIEFFGNSDAYMPTFIITMHDTEVAVSRKKPHDNINPYAYQREFNFVVNFKGAGEKTPKGTEQSAVWNRTITALKGSGKIIPEGKYDTPWKVDIDTYQTVKVPVVTGYHTKVKEVVPKKPTQVDQVVNVTYYPNGHLIPVDENGIPLKNVDHPQFKTSATDPTKIEKNVIVPTIKGYVPKQVMVTPTNLDEDYKLTYYVKKDDSVLILKGDQQKKNTELPKTEPLKPKNAPSVSQASSQPEAPKSKPVQVSKPTEQSPQTNKPVVKPKNEIDGKLKELVNNNKQKEKAEQAKRRKEVERRNAAQQLAQAQATKPTEPKEGIPALTPKKEKHSGPTTYDLIKSDKQVAFVNFIDIDNGGVQLTSSGPLVGDPGDSINDLYSTEIPLKVIKQAGYEIVMDTFDKKGFVQRFNNNDMMTQIFTIAVRKKRDHQDDDDKKEDK